MCENMGIICGIQILHRKSAIQKGGWTEIYA